MSSYSPQFRPYRVATYVAYFTFALTFIGSVAVSVGSDLYGHPHISTASPGDATAAGCTDDLEKLKRDLDQRVAMPLGPHAPRNWETFDADWDTFTRGFEDRLTQVQNRCIDRPAGAASTEQRTAMSLTVDRLDVLRQHLARCGMEGEREREEVSEALRALQSVKR